MQSFTCYDHARCHSTYLYGFLEFKKKIRWRHYHLLRKIIANYVTFESDEIRWWSSNFVTLRKNEILRPREKSRDCPRPKLKKLWDTLKKLCRKNLFFQKYDEIGSFDGSWVRYSKMQRYTCSFKYFSLTHYHTLFPGSLQKWKLSVTYIRVLLLSGGSWNAYVVEH